MIIKMLMFWWCAMLLIGSIVIILDYLYCCYVKKGYPITWTAEHEFKLKDSGFQSLSAYREEIWDMLVNVPRWNPNTHPTLQLAQVVGDPQRLDVVDATVSIRPKFTGDLTEEELKETTVTRKTLEIIPKERFVFATIDETAGGFATVARLQCRIEISDNSSELNETIPSTDMSDKNEKSDGDKLPGLLVQRRGTKFDSSKEMIASESDYKSSSLPDGTISGTEDSPHLTITIHGSGVVMSKTLKWYFGLDRQQAIGMRDYLGLMENCIVEKMRVKQKYKSPDDASTVASPTEVLPENG